MAARFRLLGPLEFFDGSRWCAIGAAKQRALLAVLLINRNRAVSADQLLAELWGEQPPSSAAALLAGYVWRLRRLLDDQSGHVLVTKAPGYQLVLPAGRSDLDDYETLVADGRRSLAAGDLAASVTALTSALGLWRGAPLADVALLPSVLTESARLEEARLAVIETRIGAEIGLGRHEVLLPELKAMVSRFPLRERLHEYLMMVLYRTGQQAEALGAYRDLRQLLIEELGVEPSRPLRELHERILREDPLLAAIAEARPTSGVGSASGAGVGSAVGLLPRTLPPDAPVFVGRSLETARIVDRLGRGMGWCAVHGMAGVGKTALAVHAAHQLAGRFPDGQIYLRAVDSAGRLLVALGEPNPPSDEERAVALLRSTLAGRRVLFVFDDVLGAAQVRALLPATPGSAAIVVGRAAMTEVDAEGLIRLEPLSADESMELLRSYARVADAEIARLCEYLPLALRIAAARLAQRPEWTVGELAERLTDPARRLDLLECGGLSVRASLLAGVRLLEPDILRLLGGLDLPVLRTEALAVLLAETPDVAEGIAEQLVDAGLIEPLGMGRYRVPELFRCLALTTPSMKPRNIASTSQARRVSLQTPHRLGGRNT
jgi:DNA-binding SARP family transcriptional activator